MKEKYEFDVNMINTRVRVSGIIVKFCIVLKTENHPNKYGAFPNR